MTDEPLNKKDITAELVGAENSDFIDLDKLDEVPPKADAGASQQVSTEQNAIVDIIDVGLDFAADVLKDYGYPEPKRQIWEQHGKAAMNKALNIYLPPTSGAGGAINSPAVALIIGIGALLLCMYPVIMHFIKQRKAEEEKKQIEESPKQEPERIPEPEAEIIEHDGENNTQPPEAYDIAALLQKTHPQFKKSGS